MLKQDCSRGFGPLFWSVVFLLMGSAAHADVHPVGEIVAAARQHVVAQAPHRGGKRIIEVGRVDPRVRLQRCDNGLRTRPGPGNARGARQTVIVSCPSRNWQLYVPVSERYLDNFVVARRGLARGEVITRNDVDVRQMRVSRGEHGFFEDIDAVLGMEVRRPIAAGSALKAQQLQLVAVVARGDRVVIHATGAGIQVRMEGESLANAAIGERVRVRNLSSRRIVEGVAVAAGRVRVGF